jgi:hypothetical protein
VPMGHIAHAEPAAQDHPGAHRAHAEALALPAGHDVPAGHRPHAPAPSPAYCPAKHCLHVVNDVAPMAALALPTGHRVHVVALASE